MIFVQAEIKLKKPVTILNRGDVARAVQARVRDFGKTPTKCLVDITIQVKYKNAVWKTVGYAAAANPVSNMVDYAQWLQDLEGVAYESISQVCGLNITSFYSDYDAVVIQINERA